MEEDVHIRRRSSHTPHAASVFLGAPRIHRSRQSVPIFKALDKFLSSTGITGSFAPVSVRYRLKFPPFASKVYKMPMVVLSVDVVTAAIRYRISMLLLQLPSGFWTITRYPPKAHESYLQTRYCLMNLQWLRMAQLPPSFLWM